MFEDIPLLRLDDVGFEEKSYIESIESLLKDMNLVGQINKPHRNLIITGIPGSGVELLESLLNSIDNIVCSGDAPSDINALPQTFIDLRKSILDKYNCSDSHDQTMNKSVDEDVVVCLKLNLTHLMLNEMLGVKKGELGQLMEFGYRIIAIVRDPVYTIANWNQPDFVNIPEAMITDANLSSRWNNITFGTQDKILRQALLWHDYAKLFLNLKKIIKIYTYEQITLRFKWVLGDLCSHLTLLNPETQLNLTNLNIWSKYDGIEEIKKAVDRHCLPKNDFGYINAGAEGIIPPDLTVRDNVSSSGNVDFQQCLNRWQSGQPLTGN